MAATTQIIIDGGRVVVMKFEFSGDTGEAAVTKVDVSTLATHPTKQTACNRVAIERIWHTSTDEIGVDILWDADTDVIAWSLRGDGKHDFRSIGPITNNAGTGVTGDINFTTQGTEVATSRYAITLQLRKTYA